MKGVFTSLNRSSYIKDVCLVYILSVNQEYRLFCQLANGVSKIPWGWMQEVFSLCLSSSPHPSPTVFSFDAVGERPAQSISKSAEQTIKSRNIATPQNTIRTFLRFSVSQGIRILRCVNLMRCPTAFPGCFTKRTSTEEKRFLQPYICVLSEGK